MKKTILTLMLLACSANGFADAGDWLFRAGGSVVDPKSDNHDLVDVEESYMVTFNGTYFITDQWAVELLAALPFEHDIDAKHGGKIGEVKHLPPTLSAQYHFLPNNNIRPYVGAGFNYTFLYEEDLDGADLDLDNSAGWAAQIGVDIDISDKLFMNAEVRYLDIDSDAKVNGVSIGTIEIDPLLFGINVGFRF